MAASDDDTICPFSSSLSLCSSFITMSTSVTMPKSGSVSPTIGCLLTCTCTKLSSGSSLSTSDHSCHVRIYYGIYFKSHNINFIVSECHHAPSESYNILFSSMRYLQSAVVYIQCLTVFESLLELHWRNDIQILRGSLDRKFK